MSGSIRVWPFANILLLIFFFFTQRFGRSFESVMFLEDCWDKGKDVQNVTHFPTVPLTHAYYDIHQGFESSVDELPH